jgi:hypothetical protein
LPDTFTAVGEFTAVTLTFDPHLNFTTARAHTHLTSLSRQIRQPAHRGVGDLILALDLSVRIESCCCRRRRCLLLAFIRLIFIYVSGVKAF